MCLETIALRRSEAIKENGGRLRVTPKPGWHPRIRCCSGGSARPADRNEHALSHDIAKACPSV